ncbi:MAG: RNA methyltransferase [Alicyclobacillus herbarius]|uniref:TrmH family RNA methyltransferase n=1 Tax=Alicyclobacillus herbarius TaxID=122960 RepID=UPI002355C7AA|nr:RNA methyltransferase [Alicyclobacillus herbarius]MCL6633126.1 RNA methyltransferase [Alicyclobacillus herbarius]
MYIDSPANDRVRAWARLKTRRGRTQQRAFLAEGPRQLQEALAARVEILAVLWDVSRDELDTEVQRELARRSIPFVELSPQAFAAVSDTVTPQGVISVIRLPEPGAVKLPARCVMLDGIQDPGNVGTLLRTAEAFGLTHVCCAKGTADPFAPKVVRAAMGGLFRLTVIEQSALDFVRDWRAEWPDGQVLAAGADGSAECHRLDYRRPTLMVIGSEAHGVSEPVQQAADHEVRIPMPGGAESLNAAVAGAILLYEMTRPT